MQRATCTMFFTSSAARDEKGLPKKAHPADQLGGGTDQGISRTHESDFSPHQPPQRTAELFRIIEGQSVALLEFFDDGSCTDSENARMGHGRLRGPHAEDQPSSNELLANRLAPCTPLQATSPAAYNPGNVVAPCTSVHTPPIM